jgi:hypothetical protein
MGHAAAAIARDLRLAPRTVRHFLRHAQAQSDSPKLQTDYRNAGRWTPPTNSNWAADKGSVGYDGSMSAVGPSWAPPFFPRAYWAHVPEDAVQTQLRQAFARWGLPGGLRVDNGTPWGSWSDRPPVLALWLIGLGVAVQSIPPRQPQHNGVVDGADLHAESGRQEVEREGGRGGKTFMSLFTAKPRVA